MTTLFALSGQPVIGLELTVTNLPSDPARPQADGDDAHEAQLLVTLPDSLHYSGVRALDSGVRTWGRVGKSLRHQCPTLTWTSVPL